MKHFDNHYTTLQNHLHPEQDDKFETYGEDIEFVKRVHMATPRRVWTVIDWDDKMIVIAGFHWVNRILYLISNEMWKDENEQYL